MNISDETLITRVVTFDDRHAFAQLVRRYQSNLRHSLRHFCNDDNALSDDLAQESFLKAYRAIKSFRRDSKFSTWLYKIAYNEAVSYFRKTNMVDFGYNNAYDSQCTHSSTLKLDVEIDINRALLQLSIPQRHAIHLCFQREFSHQEAAEIMKIPLGTLKTHVLRGRKNLTALLASHDEATTQEDIEDERQPTFR